MRSARGRSGPGSPSGVMPPTHLRFRRLCQGRRYSDGVSFHRGMRVLVDVDGRPEPQFEEPGTILNVSDRQGQVSVELDRGGVTLKPFDRVIPE